MNRIQAVAGGAVALLAVLSVTELYFDRSLEVSGPGKPVAAAPGEAPATETKPVAVDEIVDQHLPGLEEGTETGRLVTLGSFLDQMEGPEYARAPIPFEAQDRLVKAMLAAAAGAGQGPEESARLWQRLDSFVASRARGPAAKEHVMKILAEGPYPRMTAVLPHLGSPEGVGGRDVFAKVVELGAQGIIPGEQLPKVLRRTGGRRSAEPILALMRSTDSWRVISACAVALQDLRDPAHLGPVLERLEQTGLLDDPKRMPWISPELLSAYLETAQGSDLLRGIKAVRSRVSLASVTVKALERGLESADPVARLASAEAVKKAVAAGRVPLQEGESLLAGRLGRETEAVLKAELTGGLEQIRGLKTEAPQTGQQ